MNLNQALMENVGTCRSDVKGESWSGSPARLSVPMPDTGAEQLAVVLKLPQSGSALTFTHSLFDFA
ncbi:MAG: hypothetical protein CO186_04405 [Zetaproteobacteria bacterium CG_4_9_14_3_um_filter_49_83]|nr:MAG: hypothetical protein COW62_09295 [Zetaproteobacteria bacterium CG17_big_fil_post_rev_8_21_14_2_50_50_13]PIY54666.1 MAG: hypothetical protein COZ00_14075 [Zetaproteobacteria bacterium CG_4_10_14_0_8_um_filter_49_80]PJA35603.1 MAG: hypothetical protein CO186_04405 [Zetaproteobacteria bacterium CG_4_9_14_3_um_filter_49_83]